MRKLSIFTFALVIIITNNLFGKFIEIPDNSEKQLVECLSSNKNLTNLKFSLTGYERETSNENGEEYQKFKCVDEGWLAEPGLPDLPRITRLIAIPNKSSVSVEAINVEEEILSDIDIYPYQPEYADVNSESKYFIKDIDFYNKDEVYPKKIVEVGAPAILRDIRVVNVTINPFQYNPKKKELHIIKNADIKVTYNSDNVENIKTRERKISRFFEPLYKSVIINYDEIFETKEYQHGSYLFIYPDDTTIAAYLQPLTTWKHQKGFEVVAANTSQTGTTSYSIKNYIQNAYDTWPNPPEFICLVGDAGGSYSIPTGHYGYGEGDHYYTLLEGNDILADAFIGRLSFNYYNELYNIINKILHYEREPYMDNVAWYRKALLVGDPSSSGASCIIINKYIKEVIQQNTGYYSFDEVYSGNFVNQISTSINNGVSYFNYRGWLGMSGWSNSNTAALNNGYMLPFVVIPTCGTGDFEGTYDCESEYFLKAGSVSIPKGAIGAVGTATMSTHTSFNNFMSSGIFYGIFSDRIFNMGGAVVRGKVNLYNCFPNNPNNWVDKFSYWNNLMGDPGMELWTDIPMQMNVIYDNQVPIGSNYLEVTVNSIFGFPMEGAWVTALKGNDEIFATGFTDTDGKVFLPIDATSSGTVNLTVTKHNFIPHLGSFNIAEETYFANILDYIIDDDNTGSSSGNGDGIINPGEHIELRVRLKNYGTVTLNSVSATISTNSPFVIITDDSEDYGNIPSNSSAYSSDDFDFSVEPACLGGVEIQFDLLIEDGSGHQWNDKLYFIVEGPSLYAKNYSVIDGNNGILDPGETAEIVVTIRNIGSVVANDITGILKSLDTTLIITDSVGYFGNVLPEEEVNNNSNRFEITSDTQIIPGTQFSLELHLTNSDGYDDKVTFTFEVGEVFVTDPLGPDEYGYYCYDSGDTEYDIAPVYSWIEIDPNYGGSGTVIPLYDNGDTGDIETISLPFEFPFYGNRYSTITVCSNGWIAPGVTEQYAFMNSPLPGPQGPSPMIAAFWDDLRTGGGHVCYYYNSSSHYFIIEWSHLQNDYGSSEETFQVILYDPAYFQTPTGDSDILMQYKVVNNVNQGNYSDYLQHGEYSTVGLENSYGTIGLEYTFCNQYPTAAKPLENNLALLFTTQGSGVLDPPEANFTPEEFNFILEPGESIIDTLSISNTGPSNLMFSIAKDYHLFKDSGGPDSFGYIWKDSDETNGPEYNWVNISEIGTQLSFTHNDYAVGPFDIGFDFNFYGETYNEFIINPNGWIGFGDDWTDYHNYSIPRVDAPRPAIFGFWDDLNPVNSGNTNGSGYVYYYSNGIDSLIVSYIDVIHYPGTNNGTYNFQIIITNNDRIKFQYRSVSGDINSSTIGIQNADGTIGLEVAYNQNYVHDSLAVEFVKSIDWLTLSTNNGIVFPNNTQDIYLNVNTDELDNGIYLCDLFITTNDPNHSVETIPVNLTITTGGLGYVQGNVTLIGGSGSVDSVEIDIGSIVVHPDESGFFEASILPGTYILTATLKGYDTFTTEIEIVADETTIVNIILQYIEAPENIWVDVSEDYTANVFWNSIPSATGKPSHVFQSYTLLKKYNEEDWQIIVEGLTDTTYSDSLLLEPDGVYRYGVKAIFETGQSEITESEPFSLFRFVGVEFNISLSDGATPVGISLNMSGLDSIYSQNFSDTTGPSGVLHFADVYMTDYSLIFEKEGYVTLHDTSTISPDSTEFWYVLQKQVSISNKRFPNSYAISQNYPNPFYFSSNGVSETKICYQLPKSSVVKIYVYNIKGEKVRTLVNTRKDPGYYEIGWNGRDDNNRILSSGIYFYKLQVGNKVIDTKKCLILR